MASAIPAQWPSARVITARPYPLAALMTTPDHPCSWRVLQLVEAGVALVEQHGDPGGQLPQEHRTRVRVARDRLFEIVDRSE